MKQPDEERLKRQKEYKEAHKEQQKIYTKNWQLKNKKKTEEDRIQERIDYIKKLFEE